MHMDSNLLIVCYLVAEFYDGKNDEVYLVGWQEDFMLP